MKRLKVFYLFITILLSGIMFSCGNTIPGDDSGSSSSGSNGSNNLSKGQIEIKVYPDANNRVSFTAITQTIKIDWGDSSVDDLTPNGVSNNFPHTYSNQNLQTVKVNTEGMTFFSAGSPFSLHSFQELRFGNCPELKSIGCSQQKLTVLDVSKCTALTDLSCGDPNLSPSNQLTNNQLTNLDVSKCTALINLSCRNNKLTSLDVSKCTALIMLYCDRNKLTSLDVSKCTALSILYCSSNQLSASALNSLFNSLPTRKSEDKAIIYCGNNPGFDTCDKTIATKKGWTVS